MRAPSWESSVGALSAFFNSSVQCFMADLYTFTLAGGGVLRYASADVGAIVNGVSFPLGPIITRGKTKLTVGISVDTLGLTIDANSAVQVNGAPILQFIAGGGLDGAVVLLERAFSASPGGAWVGKLGLFSGRVSDAQVSRYEAQVTVNSDSELLNVMVPRNVYQPGCSNTLFDGACGLSKATYAIATTATSASDATRTAFNTNSPASSSDYFAQGWAVCLTGANAGVGRTIKTYSIFGNMVTIQPWPAAVTAGDTFTLYPGCDKQQATCNSKFANLVHFRGQPYVPAPETVT